MKKLATILLLITASFLSAGLVRAQEWTFVPEKTITFSVDDSLVRPYLATFDASGNLWVISTAIDSQFTGAGLNALYRAAPGQTTFDRVQLFDRTLIFGTTGVTAVGDDIYVSARMAAPANFRDPWYPYTTIYRYPGGSPDFREAFTDPIFDYGSWFTGIAAMPDGLIIAARSWRPTIVAYDFRADATVRGATISQAGNNDAALDPGGDTDGYGSNWIKDVALIPGGDYTQTTTPIYTSRNRNMFDSSAPAGGIAVWTGGTAADLTNYRAQQVIEPSGALIFEARHPNGIALDEDGLLYVANTANRWVKVFEMFGSFADQAAELPSATTTRPGEQEAEGAPFQQPADVVVRRVGEYQEAYVIDRIAQRAFFFTTGQATSVADLLETPAAFTLGQAYPNPFNPTTTIPFELGSASHVRLDIFDSMGRLVRTAVDEFRGSGSYQATFEAGALPSGVYLYRLTTGTGHASGRMTLLK